MHTRKKPSSYSRTLAKIKYARPLALCICKRPYDMKNTFSVCSSSGGGDGSSDRRCNKILLKFITTWCIFQCFSFCSSFILRSHFMSNRRDRNSSDPVQSIAHRLLLQQLTVFLFLLIRFEFNSCLTITFSLYKQSIHNSSAVHEIKQLAVSCTCGMEYVDRPNHTQVQCMQVQKRTLWPQPTLHCQND